MQVTPGIPVETKVLQQAVALVEEAEVIFPIFCQLEIAQQHSGEEEVQTALHRIDSGPG